MVPTSQLLATSIGRLVILTPNGVLLLTSVQDNGFHRSVGNKGDSSVFGVSIIIRRTYQGVRGRLYRPLTRFYTSVYDLGVKTSKGSSEVHTDRFTHC